MLDQPKLRQSPALKLLAVFPAIFIGFSILEYGVDNPLWDEWLIGGYLDKFAHGTLSFHDLFAQQNEYRQFFPNMIFVAVGWLTSWDVRYWMAVSFLMACLVSVSTYHLGKYSFGENTWRAAWAYVAANVLIFSPVQYENWLQGQQLIYFLPVACLTASLLIASDDHVRVSTRFVFCAAASIISSFSSVNGMLCWILLLPVLAWSPSRDEFRGKRRWIAGWIGGFVLTAALYVQSYQTPMQHDPFALTHASPFAVARHFLAILGRPLTLGRNMFAASVGFVLISLFTWLCLWFWRKKRSSAEAKKILCWLMLGAYSILTAGLITIGRFDSAPDSVPAVRYTTYSLYLPVALVYLLALMLGTGSKKVRLFTREFSSGRVLSLLLVAVVIIHLPIYLLGIRQMSSFRVGSLHSKACVLFVNVVEDKCLTERVYPRITTLKENINAANRLGFIRPALITSNRIEDIDNGTQQPLANRGAFERLVQVEANEYAASGWANLPERGEPPDAVLLAHEEDGDPAVIFAIAPLNFERDIVSALIRRAAYRDSRWVKRFSPSGIDLNRTKITAWGFDAYSGKVYKLDGEHPLPK